MRWWITLGLGLALAGCAQENSSAVRVSVIDSASKVELDAARPEPAAQHLRLASAQGLVRFDSRGDIVPGLAERWIVTDDGRSFIFRLANTRWQNGDPVTAEQVARILSERLATQRRLKQAADLTSVRDIRAMTGRVVEVRLLAPKPDLLTMLAQPEFAVRRNGWGTGPMRIRRGERWFRLVLGLDEAMPPGPGSIVRPVFLRAEKAPRAIARFLQGEVELVLGGRFEHLPYLSAASLEGNQVRLDPVSGLFGLAVVEDRGFLAEPYNREAIAMAIDRSALMAPLGLGQWQTTSRLVPPGVREGTEAEEDRWAPMTLAERRRVAAARVARWEKLEGPIKPLRVALPDGPGGSLLFRQLRADLATIGLEAERVAMRASADLRLLDRVARYNQPIWYLNQLSCDAQRICDEDADLLLSQARLAATPEVRAAKIAEAEAALTLANTFVPLGTPVRFALVKGNLSGFAPTENGWHPLPDIAFIPK